MDETICIVICSNQAEGLAQCVGRLQTTQEELVVKFIFVEREDTHRNGTNLILAQREKFALRRNDAHPIALLRLHLAAEFILHPIDGS